VHELGYEQPQHDLRYRGCRSSWFVQCLVAESYGFCSFSSARLWAFQTSAEMDARKACFWWSTEVSCSTASGGHRSPSVYRGARLALDATWSTGNVLLLLYLQNNAPSNTVRLPTIYFVHSFVLEDKIFLESVVLLFSLRPALRGRRSPDQNSSSLRWSSFSSGRKI